MNIKISKKSSLIIVGVLFLVLAFFIVNDKFSRNNNMKTLEAVVTDCNPTPSPIKSLHTDKIISEDFSKYQSGGTFIDDEGCLNKNIVDPKNTDKKVVVVDGVKYHRVKYSEEYLNNIVSKLSSKMTELGIGAIETDIINNRVNVYLKKVEFLKVSNIKRVADFPDIKFIEQDIKMTF